MAWNIAKKFEILELYKIFSSYKLAKISGVPHRTIVRWARRAGISRKRGQRDSQRGSKNPNWGMRTGIIHSKELKKKAVELYNKGLTYEEIKHILGLNSVAPVGSWVREVGISRNACGKKELHWNWKCGITPKNIKIRNSPEYRKWRMSVFERDRWTCQSCGQVGGGLHAHHILSFEKYPKLRFETKNGVALCVDCHKPLHFEKKKVEVV